MQPKNYAPEKGVLVIEDIVRENFFAQAIYCKDKIVFCFQGSCNLKDWYYDLSIDKIREGNTIATGFYDGWIFFKSRITEIVQNYAASLLSSGCKPMFEIRGHSLGAALGTLCARHIAKNLDFPCRAIVYGSPNIGNETYQKQFDILPIDHSRIRNGRDAICDLPPYDMNFRAVGKEIKIPAQWWKCLMPWTVGTDHVEYEKDLMRTGM